MRHGIIFAAALAIAGYAAPNALAAEKVTILGGGVKGQPYQFAVGLSKILK